jgi:hypothetical protein
MQSNARLHEACAGMLRRWRADANGGASADAIEGRVGIDHRRHAQEGQELEVERAGGFEIRRGQKNMRDAVDLHLVPPSLRCRFD